MQLAVGLMGQIAGNIVCDFNPMLVQVAVFR